jgi:hypothetical protein
VRLARKTRMFIMIFVSAALLTASAAGARASHASAFLPVSNRLMPVRSTHSRRRARCTVAAGHRSRAVADRHMRGRSKRRCSRRSKLLSSPHRPASDSSPGPSSPAPSKDPLAAALAPPPVTTSVGSSAPPESGPTPEEPTSEVASEETAGEPAPEEVTSEEPGGKQGRGPPFRFFAAGSFWNESLPADAPLQSNSAARMRAFVEQIDTEEQSDDGPWINTTKSGVPVYTVPANQPTVPVQLVNHVPEPALSAAWSAVPLPPTAEPASGHDGDLVVWQPSTDQLWEFDHMIHAGGGWRAEWGGAMRHVLSSAGVYGSRAWPGAHHWWGMSASSLSLVGGLIFIQDLELGQINHALEMSLPERAATIYASPAQRTDGESTNPLALPEGAHLRLNPKLNLAALHLPHLTLILAEAAQRYGIFVTDGTGVSGATTFFAQEPPPGSNPYTGPDGYFEGKRPNQLLASFPWSELELLKMELHKRRHAFTWK